MKGAISGRLETHAIARERAVIIEGEGAKRGRGGGNVVISCVKSKQVL